MKHYFTLFLLFVLAALPVCAEDTETTEVAAVKFVLKDATTVSVAKSEISKILLEKTQVVVVPTEGDSQTAYDKSNVERIELNATTTTGIKRNLKNIASMHVGSNCVSVESLPAGTVIAIYTADGRCVSTLKCANGNATLSTASLAHGAYVVRAGNLTLKFVK